MQSQRGKSWEKLLNQALTSGSYPQWPCESMVRICFGGAYLKNRIPITQGMKVLDVGCGAGNNLLPFIVRGAECYGTEITDGMAKATQQLFKSRGHKVVIRKGTNRNLPFDDNQFDLLLSMSVLHYEGDEKPIKEALKEYRRVLKPGGRLVCFTGAPKHSIYRNAKKIKPRCYQIRDYDFRDGLQFYCYETEKNLSLGFKEFFESVETGRVTEKLMRSCVDVFIGVAQKAK